MKDFKKAETFADCEPKQYAEALPMLDVLAGVMGVSVQEYRQRLLQWIDDYEVSGEIPTIKL